jgi:hypothetical protein
VSAVANQKALMDATEVCDELSIKLSTLRRMADRGEYPELLHVTRGIYRVRRVDHEAWKAGRWTSAEKARSFLMHERARAILLGKGANN